MVKGLIICGLVGIGQLGVLSACGSLPGVGEKSGGGQAAPAPRITAQGKPDGGGPSISMAFANAAARPACSAELENQLAYIQDSKEFQVCRSGEWAAIDVTAPAGQAGADGRDSLMRTVDATSTACPSGGKTVQAGRDDDGDGTLDADEVESSATVCNGEAAPANKFWTSPSTGKKWTYAGTQISANNGAQACAATGWAVPTEAQIVAALSMGMYTSLGGAGSFVMCQKNAGGYGKIGVNLAGTSCFDYTNPANNEAYQVCVEQ